MAGMTGGLRDDIFVVLVLDVINALSSSENVCSGPTASRQLGQNALCALHLGGVLPLLFPFKTTRTTPVAAF